MYEYISGVIIDARINYIVIDINGVGYKLIVANPYNYNINEEYKVYTYTHVREEEYTLYGFKTFEERELFLKLIDVKGLGPKMAMSLLASSSISGIKDAIERENILYLKKIPRIGEKLARQIILDLKGKLVLSDSTKEEYNEELISALQSLGYKINEIKKVVSKIDKNLSIEVQIKEALKLLLNS